MKKIVKIIGAAGAVALAAGLVPYHFKSDKETGEFELGGLLWNLKKSAGEEEDTYTMELLPFVDKEDAPAEEAAAEGEAPAEEQPVEEPFAEEVSNDVVVEEVEAKKEEVPEEPFAEEPQVEVTVEVVAEEPAQEEPEAASAEDTQ